MPFVTILVHSPYMSAGHCQNQPKTRAKKRGQRWVQNSSRETSGAFSVLRAIIRSAMAPKITVLCLRFYSSMWTEEMRLICFYKALTTKLLQSFYGRAANEFTQWQEKVLLRIVMIPTEPAAWFKDPVWSQAPCTRPHMDETTTKPGGPNSREE